MKDKIKIATPIVVEGKYDKIKLSSVIDGEIITDTLKSLEKDREWLNTILKKKQVDTKNVFLLTVSDGGEFNLIKKEGCEK